MNKPGPSKRRWSGEKGAAFWLRPDEGHLTVASSPHVMWLADRLARG